MKFEPGNLLVRNSLSKIQMNWRIKTKELGARKGLGARKELDARKELGVRIAWGRV